MPETRVYRFAIAFEVEPEHPAYDDPEWAADAAWGALANEYDLRAIYTDIEEVQLDQPLRTVLWGVQLSFEGVVPHVEVARQVEEEIEVVGVGLVDGVFDSAVVVALCDVEQHLALTGQRALDPQNPQSVLVDLPAHLDHLHSGQDTGDALEGDPFGQRGEGQPEGIPLVTRASELSDKVLVRHADSS